MYTIVIETKDSILKKVLSDLFDSRNLTYRIKPLGFQRIGDQRRVKAIVNFMEEHIIIPTDMPVPMAVMAAESFIQTTILQNMAEQGLVLDAEGQPWDLGFDKTPDMDVSDFIGSNEEWVPVMIMSHPNNIFKAKQISKRLKEMQVESGVTHKDYNRLQFTFEVGVLMNTQLIYIRVPTHLPIQSAVDRILPLLESDVS